MIRVRSGNIFCADSSLIADTVNLIALARGDVNAEVSPIFAGKVDRFLRRIDDGHTILGHAEGGRIIAYFWTSLGPTEVPLLWNGKISVPEGATYIWDCKTDAEYRGQGLYTLGLNTIRKRSSQCLLAVEDGNDAALKASNRAGFVRPVARYFGVLLYRLSLVKIGGHWSAHLF